MLVNSFNTYQPQVAFGKVNVTKAAKELAEKARSELIEQFIKEGKICETISGKKRPNHNLSPEERQEVMEVLLNSR